MCASTDGAMAFFARACLLPTDASLMDALFAASILISIFFVVASAPASAVVRGLVFAALILLRPLAEREKYL